MLQKLKNQAWFFMVGSYFFMFYVLCGLTTLCCFWINQNQPNHQRSKSPLLLFHVCITHMHIVPLTAATATTYTLHNCGIERGGSAELVTGLTFAL